MKVFVIVALSMFILSACQLTRVEGEVDDVEIKVSTKDEGHHHKDGDWTFCPPGQAKKGNCG